MTTPPGLPVVLRECVECGCADETVVQVMDYDDFAHPTYRHCTSALMRERDALKAQHDSLCAAWRKDAERWNAFLVNAHISTNDDGGLYLGTILTDDVDTYELITNDERAALKGQPHPFPMDSGEWYGFISNNSRINAIIDAAQPEGMT